MSRITKNILAILVLASLCRSVWAMPSDEPSEMLTRAEALYYEADFAKSVELLLRADAMLQQQSGHLDEKIDVKMQLALGYMGLNDNSRAKTYLVELYALDANHRIDPDAVAPKVIQLAEEAKAEQNAMRCQSLLDEAQKQLGAGNGDAVVKVIGPNQAGCPGLAAVSAKAADLVFKEGLESYKKTQMTEALQKFRTALVLEPGHELAGQYLELTQSKVELTMDRTLIAWRKDFNAGDFAAAARDYRDLTSMSNSPEIEDIRLEYRRALSSRADSWSQACASNDFAAMEDLRTQVGAIRPEPSFGDDIVGKMKTCANTSCIPMDSQLALTRLKSRVDPQFPAQVMSQIKVLPMTVRVKANIDVNGNVATSGARGGDSLLYTAIRSAVDQWKFLPAITEGGPRCVDTEIPLVIRGK